MKGGDRPGRECCLAPAVLRTAFPPPRPQDKPRPSPRVDVRLRTQRGRTSRWAWTEPLTGGGKWACGFKCLMKADSRPAVDGQRGDRRQESSRSPRSLSRQADGGFTHIEEMGDRRGWGGRDSRADDFGPGWAGDILTQTSGLRPEAGERGLM